MKYFIGAIGVAKALGSLAVTCTIIWAIVTLVHHFCSK